MEERIYEPLMKMLEDEKAGNMDEKPIIASGYRTEEKQQSLYDQEVEEYLAQGYSESEAKREAEQWVAVPGYGEHQLGLAVDINGATYDYIFGYRKTVIGMDSFSAIQAQKQRSPALSRGSGITATSVSRPLPRLMSGACAWKNIWRW